MENEQFYKASIEKQSHTSCQFEKTHEAPFSGNSYRDGLPSTTLKTMKVPLVLHVRIT